MNGLDNKKDKKISFKYDVIMATYNGEEYICAQLDSILNQTLKPSRIIIRDDGSTDRTEVILEYYKTNFPEILLIKDYLGNLGYIKNFESLCKYTESEVVFFSDQDDVWLENKAEIILRSFEDHNYFAAFSNAYLVDSMLKTTGLLLPQNFDFIKSSENILHCNFVTGCTLAVRREILISMLPFPVGIPHDYWVAANCSLTQNLKYINTPLVKYRQHESNVIGVGDFSIAKKVQRLMDFGRVMERKKFHEEKNALLNEIRKKRLKEDIDLSGYFMIGAYARIYNNSASISDFFKVYKSNGFFKLVVSLLDSIFLYFKIERK